MIEKIYTETAPGGKGVVGQAVKAGNLYFLSGQTGITLEGKYVGDTVEAQAEQVMKNIGAILASQGLDYTDVAKTTCFLTDIQNKEAFNKVYSKYFKHQPARSCFAVGALGEGCLCEVEVVAVTR